MYCNTCKYKNINKIRLYDYIIEKCERCEYCSIFMEDYFNFIKMAIIQSGFLNINVFTVIDMLSFKDQEKYQILYDSLNIDLNILEDTNKKCRICGEDLFEIKKDKNFSLFICRNCINVYFNEKQFKNYLEKKIKFIEKYYFLIYIKERFLRFFKRSKNNVKE